MLRLVTIVGARPQFIKAAPVSKALLKNNINEILVNTGQHYDDEMAGVFFRELNLPEPKYNLKVGSGSHAEMTSKMLIEIEKVLNQENPDMVLVYGDTNTTLAGAITAAKLTIPIVHVESGLRSFRGTMPEEINRKLTDHCSTILLCPTRQAVKNLKNEGLGNEKVKYELIKNVDEYKFGCKELPLVINVGDVMADALLNMREHVKKHKPEIVLPENEFVLFTFHRAESTNEKENVRNIIDVILKLTDDISIVFPVHPRTKAALIKYKLFEKISSHNNLYLMEPLSYKDFIYVQSNAKVVITDSGGVQKESAILEVPCITIRDETEWVETVDAGWNQIVGGIPPSLNNLVKNIKKPTKKILDYGDGKASERISKIIVKWLSK